MIDDPPLVRLRRRVPRPTAEQLGALRGTPTGYIADALHGRASLGREVKPVVPEQAAFCGAAVTIHAGPADNLAVFAALPLIQASDVLVVATDGYKETAVVGDLVLGMAKNLGAVAFVTDGCEDSDGFCEVHVNTMEGLNPVENIWQFVRDNWLSSRVFASYADIVDHCCYAWNRLTDQPWTIMSIGLRDWANA